MSWLIFLALLLPAPQDPQFPPIGIIDFYGLRSISERQVRESLQIKEDDPSSVETKEAERKLKSLPGVAEAQISRVCCDAGKAVLFVGIRQKALPSLNEMARWKSSGHAYASFFLLGRVAGIPEGEITAAWERGDRASFIETAIKRAKAI